jgi:hypothetical protein
VDGLEGRRRPFREGHGPRNVGDLAVVVADQEAADAPERLPDGQRGRDAGRDRELGQLVHVSADDPGDRSADQASVPGDARAREEELREGNAGSQADVDREVDLRAQDAADHRVDQQARGEFGVESALLHSLARDPEAGQEGQRHHHAEGADGIVDDRNPEELRVHASPPRERAG